MFKKAADRTPAEIAPGLARAVVDYGEKLMLAEFTLTAGTALPPHAHPHEQITYVLSGTLRFTLGDATMELGPGDSCLSPSGVPHTAAAITDVRVLDIFSPPRADFL